MILITMVVVAEQAISFDEVLGASQTLIASIGAVAAGCEQLARFEGTERLALDAVLRVVSERMEHLASLLGSDAAENGVDPTEPLSGAHAGPDDVGVEAESLLPPEDRRTGWVLPSAVRYGSLAPELSNDGAVIVSAHSNGSAAGTSAFNGHEAGTTLLAPPEATDDHTPKPPQTTADAEPMDSIGPELPAGNPADADATPGSEVIAAAVADGSEDEGDDQDAKVGPGSTSDASDEPLADPPAPAEDKELAAGLQGDPASETAVDKAQDPAFAETKAQKPNGRFIERITEDKLATLNESRRPVYSHDKVTAIKITGDKTYEVNGTAHNLRVPTDGTPSAVMQVLNIVLMGEIAGKSEFTKLEIETSIADKFLSAAGVWQAIKRLLDSGFLERRTVSGGETIYGLPKFVEIADIREAQTTPSATEGTRSFLERAPHGSVDSATRAKNVAARSRDWSRGTGLDAIIDDEDSHVPSPPVGEQQRVTAERVRDFIMGKTSDLPDLPATAAEKLVAPIRAGMRLALHDPSYTEECSRRLGTLGYRLSRLPAAKARAGTKKAKIA